MHFLTKFAKKIAHLLPIMHPTYQQVLAKLPELETLRNKTHSAVRQQYALVGGTLIAGVGILYFLMTSIDRLGGFAMFLSFLTFVIGALLVFLCSGKANELLAGYAQIARQSLMPTLVQAVLPEANYVLNEGLEQSVFEQSGFAEQRPFNEFSQEDFIKGRIDQTNMELVQLLVAHHHTNANAAHNSRRTKVTDYIFKGLFVHLHTPNRRQEGSLWIRPNLSKRILGKNLSEALTPLNPNQDTVINFPNDPNFEQQFSVNGKADPAVLGADLRAYLLSLENQPAENLHKLFGGLYLSIQPQAIFIGFNDGRDFLPIDINLPLSESVLQDYLDELNSKILIIRKIYSLIA